MPLPKSIHFYQPTPIFWQIKTVFHLKDLTLRLYLATFATNKKPQYANLFTGSV